MEITKHIDRYRKDLQFKNYAETSIVNYVSQVTSFLYYFDKKFTEASRINVKTTNIYLHISHNLISKINSPIQNIRL